MVEENIWQFVMFVFDESPVHLYVMVQCISRSSLYCLQIDARWLIDLDKYNEWLNEEDYLVDEVSEV